MNADPLEHTWTVLAAELREAVGEPLFDVWLAPLTVAAFDGSHLVLRAPAETREWVTERFGRILQTSVAAAFGPQVKLDVEVAGAAADTARAGAQDVPAVRQHTLSRQAPNPKYTFDQFVIGGSNRFAHAAALAVAENPGTAYNPLYLCGPPGVGKTHLLHAIATYLDRYAGGLRIQLTSGEAFANDFIGALHGGNIDAFKARHRGVDVLLVDDVQFLMAKARTEEEFFHTFNHLRDAGAQIVLTSDRPPADLDRLEDRLRDRFASGLIAEVLPPDLQTRRAVLLKRVALDGLPTPPNEVLDTIAQRITVNLRALEGALIRVVAFASLTSRPVDGALTAEVLDDLGTPAGGVGGHPSTRTPTVTEVQQLTCEAFGLTREELLSSSRAARVSWPRQVAMYLAREHTGASLPSIGAEFGGRGHTTVLHACRRTAERVAADPEASQAVRELRARLSTTPPDGQADRSR
jgi:chromosomal replication initiator protein